MNNLDLTGFGGFLGAVVAVASAVYLGLSRGRQDETASLRETMKLVASENGRLRTRVEDLEKDRDANESRIEKLQNDIGIERRRRWQNEARMHEYEKIIRALIDLIQAHDIALPDDISLPDEKED